MWDGMYYEFLDLPVTCEYEQKLKKINPQEICYLQKHKAYFKHTFDIALSIFEACLPC